MMRRAVLLFLALCFAAGAALAQPAKKNVASRPTWAELTAEQQQILAPLRADWDALDRERRLKWVGIAKRYPKMSMSEQERVTRRMQAWTKLSPEQRRQARETYKQLAKQPPDRREKLREKWAEYQRVQPARPSPYPVSPAGQ